jgi:hypothetical protein
MPKPDWSWTEFVIDLHHRLTTFSIVGLQFNRLEGKRYKDGTITDTLLDAGKFSNLSIGKKHTGNLRIIVFSRRSN